MEILIVDPLVDKDLVEARVIMLRKSETQICTDAEQPVVHRIVCPNDKLITSKTRRFLPKEMPKSVGNFGFTQYASGV